MRALIISPLFPPLADAESFCGGKFAQALLDSGVESSVIYCHNVRLPPKYDESALWSSLAPITADVPNTRHSFWSRLRVALRYQTTSWGSWTATVVSKARELRRERPFDVVISRSLPWHAHLAGYWVASESGVPWVANVNDPWDMSSFIVDEVERRDSGEGWNTRRWLKRILSRADLVTFPSERLRDHTLQSLPSRLRNARAERTLIIPHIGTAYKSAEPVHEFVIVHAGKLRTGDVTGRSALAVLEGFGHFLKARGSAKSISRLVFVGPSDPGTIDLVTKLGLSENVVFVGAVRYEQSLEYIARAAVCLLIEADFEVGIFLPSKLCDYIAARKPVVALSPAIGAVNDLATQGGILRVSPSDAKGVSEAFRTLFDAFIIGELLAYAPPGPLVRNYEPRTVIERFVGAIDRLESESQSGAR